MKVPRRLGVCSAVWTFHYRVFPRGHEEYEARKGTGRTYISNHEIDIELPGRPGHKIEDIGYDWCLCNTWVGERKQDHTTGFTRLPAAVNDGRFHTWRFDWHTGGGSLEPRVEFYLDGKPLRTITTHVPIDAGRLWVGLWFPRNWAGKPDFDVQVLEVDWVRITPFNEPNDRWIYSRGGASPLLKGPEDWPARLRRSASR
jgi:beta-glucanase (GH16 family)